MITRGSNWSTGKLRSRHAWITTDCCSLKVKVIQLEETATNKMKCFNTQELITHRYKIHWKTKMQCDKHCTMGNRLAGNRSARQWKGLAKMRRSDESSSPIRLVLSSIFKQYSSSNENTETTLRQNKFQRTGETVGKSIPFANTMRYQMNEITFYSWCRQGIYVTVSSVNKQDWASEKVN